MIAIVLIFVLCLSVRASQAVCPLNCDCKWKSGKESVICLNTNLTAVPLHLETGTQVLDLTGNNLVTLSDEEFSKAGLINLQRVHLPRCRLRTIERYAFRDLINLVELDLSHNSLTAVPTRSFDVIPELRDLKLSGNPIRRVQDGAFAQLPQLERLELVGCRLIKIDPGGFSGLERTLKELRVDGNELGEVDAASFTSFRHLNELGLAGNPWNCSCALRPLRRWMLRENVPYGVPPVCQHPRRLRGKSWDKLELDEFACAPGVAADPATTLGVEGGNVTLTCRLFSGVPEPEVRWSLRNKPITNLTGAGGATTNGRKLYYTASLSESSTSHLVISTAEPHDAGTYVCSAENKAGRSEASVALTVTKRPPEGGLSGGALVASVVTGVAFVVASCLISVCVCSVRRRQVLKWRGGRECDENYEKIEMNHHHHHHHHHEEAVKANGGAGVMAEEPEPEAGVESRKNGEYKVVPCGGDTDQEVEEEEEGGGVAATAERKWGGGGGGGEEAKAGWSSPEHLLDPDDLHIPRRTIQETRDNIKRTYTSARGTYSQYSPTSAAPTPAHLHQHHRRLPPVGASSSSTSSSAAPQPPAAHQELQRVAEDSERTFPDLIESSPINRRQQQVGPYGSTSRAASEGGGSVGDINEIFCTLPRKRDLLGHGSRYRSSDSQSPLLPDSRYGSSGGESYFGSQDNNNRRLSDSQKYPLPTNLNRNRVNKISNSYLNLTRDESTNKELPTELNATPLLDISSLESRLLFNKREIAAATASPTTTSSSSGNAAFPNENSSYDYHAAQLERFLEEYRVLQKQLTRMKETCDTLCQEKERIAVSPATPSSSSTSSSRAAVALLSPNSNAVSLEDSVDFRNFENELTKYLVSRNLSPNVFKSDV